MLTGTKIAFIAVVWSLVLTTFIVVYGVVQYGTEPEYWKNIAAIIGALLVSDVGIYGFNEWRKRLKPYDLNKTEVKDHEGDG